MKIKLNDLERLYFAAKDCSKGAIDDLTCTIDITQEHDSIIATKNGAVVYQQDKEGVQFPTNLNPKIPLGHGSTR